jgi:hypothetical protein
MTSIATTSRAALAAAIAIASVIIPATQAGAVSLRVTMACANDYFAYCSKHDPDGAAVRTCFHANGPKLSKGCVDALVAAGEVSKAEVERRAAAAGK